MFIVAQASACVSAAHSGEIESVIPLWYAALAAAVGVDRLIAVGTSRRNQRRLDSSGAKKIHDPSFTGLALLHVAYLVAAPLEVSWFARPFLPWLGVPALAALIAATVLRFWAVRTLADHWNLSVVASQGLGPVTTGPYRWIRHPNYVAIIVEVAALPLVHTAWLTALVATLLQIPLLVRRIAVEERVLMSDPDYRKQMGHKPRFFPQLVGMLVIAMLAHGQSSVRGVTSPDTLIRLLPVEGEVRSQPGGAFVFRNVEPGSYILWAEQRERAAVMAIRVDSGRDADVGRISIPARATRSGPVRVVTVCEAIEGHDRYERSEVVLVGIFKSGTEETLRQDCPSQLTTGGIAWMNAVALPPSPSSASTSPILEQPAVRKEIEKKRAEVLAGGAPGTQPRPERVVALYGRLFAPSGLTAVGCGGGPRCSELLQMNLPAVKLLDVGR